MKSSILMLVTVAAARSSADRLFQARLPAGSDRTEQGPERLPVHTIEVREDGVRILRTPCTAGAVGATGPPRTAKVVGVVSRCALAAAVLLTAAATAAAAPRTAPSGQIAFVANRAVDSGGEIYSVAAAGGSSRDLSNSRAPDSDPVVSPNRHRIAFFSTRDDTTSLYTVGTNGAAPRRSTVAPGYVEELVDTEGGSAGLVWSPDGRSIAFHRGASAYVVSARGGAPRRLSRGSFPAWSADRRLIALTVLAPHEGQPNRVVVVGADGRRLWSRPGTEPAWSPDGSKLAFTTPPNRSHPARTMVTDWRGRELAVFAGSFLGWSPDGERIAFGRGRPGLQETVYVARWNGRDARVLGQVTPHAFAWSPDARRIAFFARRRDRAGVWVQDAGSGRPRLITSSSQLGGYAEVDDWVGGSILLSGAFPENDAHPRKLYLARPDGTGLRVIAQAAVGSVFTGAAFADGGRTIVYRSEHRSGTGTTGGNELFTVQPDGTHLRQVTADGRDKQTPAWSPDGTTIAYAASDDVGRCAGCEYGIVVRQAATGKARVVGGQAGWSDDATDPAWAPDGNRIAYEDYLDETIVVRQLDGPSKDVLGSGRQPSWSPDGTLLAFITFDTASLPDYALAVMNTDGSNVRQVLPGPASDPAWSPDGEWIAYVTNAGAIRAVHADGTGDHLVLAHAAADSPAWSPDGQWLAYTGRDGYVDVVRADGSEQHRVAKGRSPSWQSVPG